MKSIPYGFWSSPISPQAMADKPAGRSDLRCDSGRLYWTERRADQGGRVQICSLPDSTRALAVEALDSVVKQHLPVGYSAQSGVHEYGGAAYCVHEELLYFVNATDQQIYRCDAGEIEQVTHLVNYRFADLQWDACHKRLVAVAEIHASNHESLPENQLVAISLNGEVTVLHQGHDFYSSPRLSAAADQIAFIAWDMPNMPWDKTILYCGDNNSIPDDGNFAALINADKQAPQQPLWFGNQLYFINDPEGFGQIFCAGLGNNTELDRPVFNVAGEIGLPMWVFGQQSYQVFDGGKIVFSAIDKGLPSLGLWSPDSGLQWLEKMGESSLSILDTHYFVRNSQDHVFFTTAFHDAEEGVASLAMQNAVPEVQPLIDVEQMPYAISKAELISVPVGTDATTYAYYYAPMSDNAVAPEGDKPPLIVIGHGGPTGMTSGSLNLQIQFWTSRGFAVADVNYRGSTGFGRVYRESLYGEWGIADVEDVAAVADYLVRQGEVSADNLIIRGKSAGGYLALAALAFTNTFTMGGVHYGVSDLSLLAEDTHKFESDYLEYLVAPYPAAETVYKERSPIHHLDQLNAPVIVLQGLEDKVVPPNQSEAIVEALQQKGITVEYVTFPGEKHGFRQPENIRTAFEKELRFYQQHIQPMS